VVVAGAYLYHHRLSLRVDDRRWGEKAQQGRVNSNEKGERNQSGVDGRARGWDRHSYGVSCNGWSYGSLEVVAAEACCNVGRSLTTERGSKQRAIKKTRFEQLELKTKL